MKPFLLLCFRKFPVIFLLAVMGLPVFCYGESVETKHFTISFCSACSSSEFAQKVNTESSVRFETSGQKISNIGSVIKEEIDSLYSEVSDSLDMHLNNYRGKINVYPDSTAVSEIAYPNSQIIENRIPSIYVPGVNTIYVSLKDVSAGMLAHEMAHAVISNYFVVAPPVKVQEILAGYVEYSIRKKMGTLPGK